MLVASYHILLGHTPTSYPFTLSQGASPVGQPSTPAAPPVPVPKQLPRPKRWNPSPDPMDSIPLGGAMSKATLEGPSKLQMAGGSPLEQCTQAEPLRSIQPGH